MPQSMKFKHTLSLVTCVYGVEEYIEQYAHSVFDQTCTDIEYIFVNDGTKDNSIQILERVIDEHYAHLRSNITIFNQTNQGLPLARKSGISLAKGDYILFADPDDWLSLLEEVSMLRAPLRACVSWRAQSWVLAPP